MALRTNKMPSAHPKQGIQKEDVFLEPRTPFEQLWQAAHQGDMLTTMKLLMVAGSDRMVNQVRDYDHTTALWAACSHGHEDMARYIIAHGGDVNISRSDGATCFYIACLQGHMLVAKLLFEKVRKLGPYIFRQREVHDDLHALMPILRFSYRREQTSSKPPRTIRRPSGRPRRTDTSR